MSEQLRKWFENQREILEEITNALTQTHEVLIDFENRIKKLEVA